MCVCVCVWQAVDQDLLAEHRTTMYHIVDGDPVLHNFTVNSTTGEIGVSMPVDYEMIPAGYKGTLTLTVMAVDSQQPALRDYTTVYIHVHV